MKASSSHPSRSLLYVHLLAALIVVAWGISFVSSTAVLDSGIGPVSLYAARFLVAYLLMWVISHRRLMARDWQDEAMLAICGICGSSVYYLAENYALRYTLATNVSLITSMTPLLSMLLIGLIYRNERPSRGALAGSGVAFLGVGMVIFNSSFVMKINPLGDLLSLAAAFSFSVYTLLLRRLQALYDTGFVTRKVFFYGIVSAIPFVVFSGEKAPLSQWLEPVVLWNVLFLTLVCTIGAFLAWGTVVKRLGAVKANNYLYFQPVVTLLFSAIFLGQGITAIGLAGSALILGGVVLSDKLGRQPQPPAH